MQIIFTVSPSDAQHVKEFVHAYRRTDFVRHRFDHCIRGRRPRASMARFWKGLVLALLTTQQRSGPKSPVQRFLRGRPFLLSFRTCKTEDDLARFAESTLRAHGGIRRIDTIAAQLEQGMALLRGPPGRHVGELLTGLEEHRGRKREREAAEYLAETFSGLGPKQSRNLLQYLGLTRYEIPIDSRVVKWLNNNGFPVRLNAAGLTDTAYYEFVLDAVQALCKAARVYPCIFDAAVFSSFDKAKWTLSDLID